MNSLSAHRPASTKGLTDSLRGRIRAIKHASDSDSHTDLGSDMGATSDSRHFVLAGQSEQGSFDDSNDKEHIEEAASDTQNWTRSQRKS